MFFNLLFDLFSFLNMGDFHLYFKINFLPKYFRFAYEGKPKVLRTKRLAI